jgi:hypothetical protein
MRVFGGSGRQVAATGIVPVQPMAPTAMASDSPAVPRADGGSLDASWWAGNNKRRYAAMLPIKRPSPATVIATAALRRGGRVTWVTVASWRRSVWGTQARLPTQGS